MPFAQYSLFISFISLIIYTSLVFFLHKKLKYGKIVTLLFSFLFFVFLLVYNFVYYKHFNTQSVWQLSQVAFPLTALFFFPIFLGCFQWCLKIIQSQEKKALTWLLFLGLILLLYRISRFIFDITFISLV